MSGPNTNYDPVEVAALDPQVIDEAVQAALDAAAPDPAGLVAALLAMAALLKLEDG